MYPIIHQIAFEEEMQIRREIDRLQHRDTAGAPFTSTPRKSLLALLFPRPAPHPCDCPCP